METIAQSVEALRTLAASFEPGRKDSALVNDMFEAADDWRGFGEPLLKDGGRGRFSERVRQERELHATLRGFCSLVIKNNPGHARLMEPGARLIAEGKQR